MQVQVSGKRIAVGDALQARITDELNARIGKYFERGGINAEVIVSKDGYDFCVECVVRLASGHQLDSHGSGPDAHATFDAALDKIETRVRRYKGRLKDHHAGARETVETTALYVLLAPESEEDGGWDELTESALASHEPPTGGSSPRPRPNSGP